MFISQHNSCHIICFSHTSFQSRKIIMLNLLYVFVPFPRLKRLLTSFSKYHQFYYCLTHPPMPDHTTSKWHLISYHIVSMKHPIQDHSTWIGRSIPYYTTRIEYLIPDHIARIRHLIPEHTTKDNTLNRIGYKDDLISWNMYSPFFHIMPTSSRYTSCVLTHLPQGVKESYSKHSFI